VDAILAALAARQHGLVTLAQLRAAGLDDSAIRKRVARGALHRVHRGVYAVGHVALSRDGRFLAAVLGAGEGAALSHLAAAELRRVWRLHASVIDVVGPARRRLGPSVRVHACRNLDPRAVTRFRGIPVTTIPRLLVDLSDVLPAHELANVIHEAAFRGWFNERAMRDAMARANGRHNLHVLEAALHLRATGSAGTRSGPEIAFLSLLQAAGLPQPRVNTHLRGHEVDFHWPDARLAVEVDGPGHHRPRTKREDALRDRVLREAGYEVLRFTDADLRKRSATVASALAARL
jgi:very-short-patch-repair endonuclease